MSHNRDPNSNPDGFRVFNTSELRDLLQDEEKMDQIVRLSEKFQELQVDRETLLTTNRSLAEESLSRRPRLQNGKLQLAEKYQELERLSAACQEKQRQLEAYTEKHSPQTAQNLLQEEVARAEEESEDLLERFMEGQVPLEAFLDSFQSSRKVYHIRRAQAEKMQEFNRSERSLRKHKEAEEERKAEKQEPRPNGFVAQGPPRMFQLRYGLTPAIILPHCPLSSASALAHASSLPPLDNQPGQPHALGSGAPHSCPGQPVGLRVIGQLPGWPARPVRLQQLYRPNQQQPEPPFR
ncbi:vacuolar protein sorting-associated protein 37D isoform X1 [Megalops cyprinoides]|uniref:vacuolar protein sorting-associated protein 37D isoform X1 n=1 Tax=Megalops cyprinoides TaxID=118141 RepID=UPI0018654C5C|nr:vacuolar protein sorting-associated protein 37D isoform X1 [Megalops cyprinoides]